MSKGTPDCLTEQHLILFGKIIQWFARHEVSYGGNYGDRQRRGRDFHKVVDQRPLLYEKRDTLFNLLRHERSRSIKLTKSRAISRSFTRLPVAR